MSRIPPPTKRYCLKCQATTMWEYNRMTGHSNCSQCGYDSRFCTQYKPVTPTVVLNECPRTVCKKDCVHQRSHPKRKGCTPPRPTPDCPRQCQPAGTIKTPTEERRRHRPAFRVQCPDVDCTEDCRHARPHRVQQECVTPHRPHLSCPEMCRREGAFAARVRRDVEKEGVVVAAPGITIRRE